MAALMIPVLASCGVVGGKKDEGGDAGSNSGLGNASGNEDASAGQGDAPAGTQSFDINKTVWYSGMKLTFGKLTYDPAKEYPEAKLAIDTTVENVSPTSVQGSPTFTIKANGKFLEGRFNDDLRTVPAGETGKTTVDFQLIGTDQEPGDLSAAELQVGDSKSVNAVVPFGAGGELVDLAPTVLLDKPISKSTKYGKVTWNKCSLEGYFPSDHEQVEKDMRAVVCYLDMQQTVAMPAGEAVDQGNFILRVPDGSVVAADEGPIQAFYRKQKITDTEVAFKIRWPAPGTYKMEVEFGEGKSTIPLTIADS
ncbi:hypothetical protein AB0M20_14130 [Actinoplanes sp. NPDC051633]|uniref:hypothetical protein n=1 Tax=Actinoplanes sp. NPDC051633 TaxID=3155670 RepID=UPI00341FAF45